MTYGATTQDILWMVELSYDKRSEYSKAQPNFWKMAKNSNEIQIKWFEEELQNDKVIVICHEEQLGFVMGKLINPPEVYDAGLTLMIDDFCVRTPDLWMTIGKELLQECIKIGKSKGTKQVLIVCGNHDAEKYKLLENMGLDVASRWYTKVI